MPRTVPPQRWERYVAALRQGHSRSNAARIAGISLDAMRAFHAGDPTSSGVRWWKAQNSLPETCPACGFEGTEGIAHIGAPKPTPHYAS